MYWKYVLSCLCVTMLSVLLLAPSAHSRKKKRERPQPKPISVEHRSVCLAPFLTGGWLTGDAADRVEGGRKALYGVGFSLEYNITPRWSTVATMSAAYGKVADSDRASVRGVTYSVSAYYHFAPLSRSTLYGLAELGLTSITATELNDGHLGRHRFLSAGFGNRVYSTPTFATRVCVFYKVIFTDGHEYSAAGYTGTADFNISYIGASLSFIVGL